METLHSFQRMVAAFEVMSQPQRQEFAQILMTKIQGFGIELSAGPTNEEVTVQQLKLQVALIAQLACQHM